MRWLLINEMKESSRTFMGHSQNLNTMTHIHCFLPLYLFLFLFFLLFSHFYSILVVWGLGVWGRGLGLGFWVWGFRWWGFGPGVWGLLGFWGWGSLYKHRRITLGKNLLFLNLYFYLSDDLQLKHIICKSVYIR